MFPIINDLFLLSIHYCIFSGPCGLCRLPILDKSFLLIDAQSWHLNCVRCVDCGENLEQLGLTCFARNGLLYCRRDYLMWVADDMKNIYSKKEYILDAV